MQKKNPSNIVRTWTNQVIVITLHSSKSESPFVHFHIIPPFFATRQSPSVYLEYASLVLGSTKCFATSAPVAPEFNVEGVAMGLIGDPPIHTYALFTIILSNRIDRIFTISKF